VSVITFKLAPALLAVSTLVIACSVPLAMSLTAERIAFCSWSMISVFIK
ncbi:MAG: hypothetical protein ACI9YP_001399, partial [Colwellia sp.]